MKSPATKLNFFFASAIFLLIPSDLFSQSKNDPPKKNGDQFDHKTTVPNATYEEQTVTYYMIIAGSSKGSPTIIPQEVIRATKEEKDHQIEMLKELHKGNAERSKELLRELQLSSIRNKNIFENLMEAVKYCSLGQITDSLFEVGGQYRRNM